MAQPKMGLDPLSARPHLLSRQRVDARPRRHRRSGPTTWRPTRCSSSWACAWIRWTSAVEGDLVKLTGAVPAAGQGGAAARAGYVFDGRLNDSFQRREPAARQGRRGAARGQGREPGLRAGRFHRRRRRRRPCWPTSQADRRRLRARSKADVTPGDARGQAAAHRHVPALSAAATWTRAGRACCSSSSRFPYTSLMDAEIKKGKLEREVRRHHPAGRFDRGDHRRARRGGAGGRAVRGAIPPEYRSGIGDEAWRR